MLWLLCVHAMQPSLCRWGCFVELMLMFSTVVLLHEEKNKAKKTRVSTVDGIHGKMRAMARLEQMLFDFFNLVG